MSLLDGNGLGKLSELLLELYAPGDLSSFRRRMLKAVHRVFDGEMVCHNEIDLQTGESLSVLARPVDGFETLREAFFVHVHEHPSIQHLIAANGRETTAVKTSDFVTQRQWRNTGLYREFYRELDDIRSLSIWWIIAARSMCESLTIQTLKPANCGSSSGSLETGWASCAALLA